ncbi:hypothetical protein H2199_004212 [Coniosporium tulheliwenetii]|uniref:Uncharacterized protein n=1 Tax=Coniosporium tulheliwenetii TaxID=3383036 RepID=A0ACC2Z7K5_9PEZI|nr:hypothetical protein H2199_004212 [Cladosporium sp. JES 115]
MDLTLRPKRAAAVSADEPGAGKAKRARSTPYQSRDASAKRNTPASAHRRSSAVNPIKGPSSAYDKEAEAAWVIVFQTSMPKDLDYQTYLSTGGEGITCGTKAQKGNGQPLFVTRMVFYWALDRSHSFNTAHVQTRWLVLRITSALEAGESVSKVDAAFLEAFQESKETPHSFSKREAYIRLWKYSNEEHVILSESLVGEFSKRLLGLVREVGADGAEGGKLRSRDISKPQLATLHELLGRHAELQTPTPSTGPSRAGASGLPRDHAMPDAAGTAGSESLTFSHCLQKIDGWASTSTVPDHDIRALTIDAATARWGPDGFIIRGHRIIGSSNASGAGSEMRTSDFKPSRGERDTLEVVQELLAELEAEEGAEMDELARRFDRTMNVITEQSRLGSITDALSSLGVTDPNPPKTQQELDDEEMEREMLHEMAKLDAEEEHQKMLETEGSKSRKGWLRQPKFNFEKLRKVDEEEEEL